MTAEETAKIQTAIDEADNLLGRLSLNRNGHMVVQQSMAIINASLNGNGASATTPPVEEPKEG